MSPLPRALLLTGALAVLGSGLALSPTPVLADPTPPPTRGPSAPEQVIDPPPNLLDLSNPPGGAPGDNWKLEPTVPDVMALHSLPGSPHTIYLNFEGADLAGSEWTSLGGSVLGFLARAADLDGVAGALSTRERGLVELIWRHVAEDFAPFDVDVTTERPLTDALTRTSRTDTTFGTSVVFTDDPWVRRACNGCTGIASMNVFSGPGTDAYRDAIVFPAYFTKKVLPQMGPEFAARLIATTASHEVGHTLGLQHDGLLASSPIGALAYHPGFSPGGPIMGSTAQPLTRWADPSVPYVDNDQDDLALLTEKLGAVPDEPASTPLVLGAPRPGVLSAGTDVDSFTFTATKAAVVTAAPEGSWSNLDIALTVTDDLNRTMTVDPPATVKSWKLRGLAATARLAAGRTYRISLAPAATPGLGAYASLGRYTVVVKRG